MSRLIVIIEAIFWLVVGLIFDGAADLTAWHDLKSLGRAV